MSDVRAVAAAEAQRVSPRGREQVKERDGVKEERRREGEQEEKDRATQ